ncbi:hypothetical protein Fot_13786 [Forsythia ovata]|uniref:Uncharacterized protein n=1 Tax=Forsythia ovata TaxID=205694 RepID=A0ABD1W6P3_9LAMI
MASAKSIELNLEASQNYETSPMCTPSVNSSAIKQARSFKKVRSSKVGSEGGPTPSGLLNHMNEVLPTTSMEKGFLVKEVLPNHTKEVLPITGPTQSLCRGVPLGRTSSPSGPTE